MLSDADERCEGTRLVFHPTPYALPSSLALSLRSVPVYPGGDVDACNDVMHGHDVPTCVDVMILPFTDDDVPAFMLASLPCTEPIPAFLSAMLMFTADMETATMLAFIEVVHAFMGAVRAFMEAVLAFLEALLT